MNPFFLQKINQAAEFIKGYNYPEPLDLVLNNYFRKNPKMGSNDRKTVKELVYRFFRFGKLIKGDLETKLKFLGEFESLLDLKDKTILNLETYFPNHDEVSKMLERTLLPNYFYEKAKVFIRVNELDKTTVIKELRKHKIEFTELDNAISFNAGNKLLEFESYKKGLFEIQDLSSIRAIGNIPFDESELILETCCGSGGKSLAILAKKASTKLTAVDVRPEIIESFKARIKKRYNYKIRFRQNDFAEKALDSDVQFDRIVIDAPCSGSGTWRRNPNHIQFFSSQDLAIYPILQKNIIKNALLNLKPGGTLNYMTCSVYKAENEDLISSILKENENLTLTNQKYFNEMEFGGDIIFSAELAMHS